jgi:hypothetical protein
MRFNVSTRRVFEKWLPTEVTSTNFAAFAEDKFLAIMINTSRQILLDKESSSVF